MHVIPHTTNPQVRSTGESPSTEDIIKVAKLFDDDLTLDNLSRPQLVSTCRYMGINAFGTDNFLRGNIRARLRALRRDDEVIAREGIELLGLEGLTDAHPALPLMGRLGALYRASVGSTISGGSAEILQVVIARRGLGLR